MLWLGGDMDTKSAAVSSENRFAPRRKRQLPAAIYFDGVPAGVRCTIIDVSTTGARIKLQPGWEATLRNTGGNAKRARLVDLAEKVSYECHVVRADTQEMGLRFSAPPTLPAAPAVRRLK